MSSIAINRRRLCSLAMGCVLWAIAFPAEAIPAVFDNNVYPVSSTLAPSTHEWPLDLVKNMSQTHDLREFIMKFIQDERICTSKQFYDLIVGQDASDFSAELWWSKRCGGRRSGGKNYSTLPESTLIRYRRKSSNRRSTQHSNSEMTPAQNKKLNKLMKNKKVQCNPKKAVVELPNDDPDVMLKPSCVYIKQCGGCCDSPLLECLPETTKVRKFKVLAIQNNKSKVTLSRQPLKTVTVEEHKKCSCQCKERAEHCTPHQVYNAAACQCTCRRTSSCPRGKAWDTNICQCVCQNKDNCTSGRYFDQNTCRCEDAEYKDVYVS